LPQSSMWKINGLALGRKLPQKGSFSRQVSWS